MNDINKFNRSKKKIHIFTYSISISILFEIGMPVM